MRQCEHCGDALDPQEVCDCHCTEDSTTVNEIALRCVTPPVIAENLTAITAYVDNVLAQLSSLPRDKEGCATAKALRADLRRRFELLEDQRKAVKNAVMEPYNAAEQAYREKISNPINAADKRFKDWIDSYQNEVKRSCQEELQAYFNELCAVLRIDFVTFHQTGVVVDMATANLKDPKKARQTISDFLYRIETDRRTISVMDHAEEIMAEYKLSLSLSSAIAAVNDRHERIARSADDLNDSRQCSAKAEQARQTMYAQAPEIIPTEEEYSVTFTVTAPLLKLKALKAYLESNHFTYEEEN